MIFVIRRSSKDSQIEVKEATHCQWTEQGGCPASVEWSSNSVHYKETYLKAIVIKLCMSILRERSLFVASRLCWLSNGAQSAKSTIVSQDSSTHSWSSSSTFQFSDISMDRIEETHDGHVKEHLMTYLYILSEKLCDMRGKLHRRYVNNLWWCRKDYSFWIKTIIIISSNN